MTGASSPRSRIAVVLLWAAAALLLAGPVTTTAWNVVPDAVADAGPWLLVGSALAAAGAVALASPRGRKRALLAAAACVVALVFAEILLRVTVGRAHAPTFRLHDTWLFEYIPGARRLNTKRDGDVKTRVEFDINSEGFRGPELLAPGAAKRVVVWGDSFVAGETTPWEETFVHRLGVDLSATQGPVEAVDAGVSGYGTDQVLLRMEEELPRLLPDLAVVVITVENDYGDMMRNHLFEVSPQGELRRKPTQLAEGLRATLAGTANQPLLATTYMGALVALRFLLHGNDDTFPDDPETVLEFCGMEVEIAQASSTVTNTFWDHVDEDVRMEPQSASARFKTRLMKHVLARIRDTARARGVPLLFVIVPSPTDIVPDYGRGQVNRNLHPQYRPENLTSQARTITDLLGVPTVDLFAPLRDADPRSLFFRNPDTHWNSAGQALSARLVAREIVARGFLR